MGYLLWSLLHRGGPLRPFTGGLEPAAAPGIRDRPSFLEGVKSARELLRDGDVEGGRLLARDLLASAEELFGPDTLEAAMAAELILEALLLLDQDRDGEAHPLAERVVRVREAQFGADDPRLVEPLLNLARVAAAKRDPAATVHLRRAVALEERRGSDPDRPLGAKMAEIGLGSLSWGLDNDGCELLVRGLANREDFAGEPTLLISALTQLARIRMRERRWPDARELLVEALRLSETCFGADHNPTGTIAYLLGMTMLSQGEPGRAAEQFRRALSIEEQVLGAEHPDVATTLLALARAMDGGREGAAAVPLVERALAIRESAFGLVHAALIEPLLLLARIDYERGEPGRCKAALTRLLDLQERTLGPEHPELVTTLRNLVLVAETMGHKVEARNLIERAVGIGEGAWGSGDTNLGPLLEVLGRMQWQAGDLEHSRVTNERILEIYRRELGSRHTAVAGKLRDLAAIALRGRDAATAEHRLGEALGILERASARQDPLARQIVQDLEQMLEAAPAAEGVRRLHRRAKTLQGSWSSAPPMAEA